MGCDILRDDDGNPIGFVCSRGSRTKTCSVCKSRRATKLCDYPLTGSKQGKTCDADLCDRCAVKMDRNVDYCPAHSRMSKAVIP